MQNFYYFNLGFKGDELATNFTNCATRTAFWIWREKVTYEVKLRYGTWSENMFNSTLFVQNTTRSLEVCTDATENLYYYLLWKKSQFPTFNDLALGFLQNLLANVIRLNSINDKL